MTIENRLNQMGKSESSENVVKPLSREEFQELKVGDRFWVIHRLGLPKELEHESGAIGPLTIYSIDDINQLIQFTSPGEEEPRSRSMVSTLISENDIFRTEADARKFIDHRDKFIN